jgi:hypothetical protein
MTQAGMILGIIGTALMILTVLFYIVAFALSA